MDIRILDMTRAEIKQSQEHSMSQLVKHENMLITMKISADRNNRMYESMK